LFRIFAAGVHSHRRVAIRRQVESWPGVSVRILSTSVVENRSRATVASLFRNSVTGESGGE